MMRASFRNRCRHRWRLTLYEELGRQAIVVTPVVTITMAGTFAKLDVNGE
jgi:hypothetical protein